MVAASSGVPEIGWANELKPENFPELKTLVLVGMPTSSLIKKIAKFPKLQELTIGDSNPINRSTRLYWENLVPHVKTSFVRLNNQKSLDALIPEEFKKHAKRIETKVRAALTKQNQP